MGIEHSEHPFDREHRHAGCVACALSGIGSLAQRRAGGTSYSSQTASHTVRGSTPASSAASTVRPPSCGEHVVVGHRGGPEGTELAFHQLAEVGQSHPHHGSVGTVLDTVWAALGGDPGELARWAVTGPRTTLASTFSVTDAATAAVGASLLAATLGSGARVAVDTRQLAVAVRSERYVRRDGRSGGSPFDPLSAFHRTSDGWLRLHANYAWHREAALRVLGCAEADAQAAIAEREAVELESALHEAGGVGAAVRTEAQWRAVAGPPPPLVEQRDLAPAAAPPRPTAARARPHPGDRRAGRHPHPRRARRRRAPPRRPAPAGDPAAILGHARPASAARCWTWPRPTTRGAAGGGGRRRRGLPAGRVGPVRARPRSTGRATPRAGGRHPVRLEHRRPVGLAARVRQPRPGGVRHRRRRRTAGRARRAPGPGARPRHRLPRRRGRAPRRRAAAPRRRHPPRPALPGGHRRRGCRACRAPPPRTCPTSTPRPTSSRWAGSRWRRRRARSTARP